jgi:hypothetical protein
MFESVDAAGRRDLTGAHKIIGFTRFVNETAENGSMESSTSPPDFVNYLNEGRYT